MEMVEYGHKKQVNISIKQRTSFTNIYIVTTVRSGI